MSLVKWFRNLFRKHGNCRKCRTYPRHVVKVGRHAAKSTGKR